MDTIELKQLATEAHNTTLSFLAWLGVLGDNKDGVKVAPYYLKWIDATHAAIDCMENDTPENRAKLSKDLSTMIITPMAGMIKALTDHASHKNIEVPQLKSDGVENPIEFRKAATEDIKMLMGMLDAKETKEVNDEH